MRRLLLVLVLAALGFLVACFYMPAPAPRYTLFPGRPDWYRLDTSGLEEAKR